MDPVGFIEVLDCITRTWKGAKEVYQVSKFPCILGS